AAPQSGAAYGLFRPVHLADRSLSVADDLPEALRQLDHLLLRPHLDQGEAENRLLGLGERAVSHGDLSSGGGNAGTLRIEPTGGERPPLGVLLPPPPPHLGDLLLARGVGLGGRHQDPHLLPPWLRGAPAGPFC